MNKIIILSDMHGWLPDGFTDKYNVIFLDSRRLASIDLEKNVHGQFVAEGIDRAAKVLSEETADLVIGFSVGGVIAWRAGLQGMKCRKIVAISATRLRYETEKPSCELELIYGEKDPFRPKNDWFEALRINFRLIHGASHEVYKELDILSL